MTCQQNKDYPYESLPSDTMLSYRQTVTNKTKKTNKVPSAATPVPKTAPGTILKKGRFSGRSGNASRLGQIWVRRGSGAVLRQFGE